MQPNHPSQFGATTRQIITPAPAYRSSSAASERRRVRTARLIRSAGSNWAATLAAGASLVLTAGCSAQSASTSAVDGRSPAASSTISAEPSKSAETPRALVDAAVDAYRGLWHAYLTTMRQPDSNDPALRQYASGDALAVFVDGLTSLRKQGLAGRGTIALTPQVDDIEPADHPTLIGVTDCVNSKNSHLFKVDGSTYRDTPGGRQQVHARVQYLDGAWKVTEFALNPKVGSC